MGTNQRPSEAMRANQRLISGHQRQSISDRQSNQRQSEAISGNQRQSVAIKGHPYLEAQMRDAISSNQRQSVAIRGHP
ncbi:hypothetical protein Ctob_002866, partial [Chrysochromulina tobinii]